jgi:hypothetical protein
VDKGKETEADQNEDNQSTTDTPPVTTMRKLSISDIKEITE